LNKLRLTLFIGCLICSLGIFNLIIPYPKTRGIIDIYGKLGILEDTFYGDTEVFPMFSSHQLINTHIYAYNGSFTLMVMDDDDFYNWAEDKDYSSLVTLNNLTYINEEIDVSALNDWPYLRCSIVIKPEDFLVITGRLSIKYFDHYYIVAFIFLAFGALALISYFYKRSANRK